MNHDTNSSDVTQTDVTQTDVTQTDVTQTDVTQSGPAGRPGPTGRGSRGGRPPGGPRGRESAPPPASGLTGWLAGRLPQGWFTGPAHVVVDRDEVTIIGVLPDLEPSPPLEGVERAQAEAGRIRRFRETTRDQRIVIARELEERWERSVAWGARLGERTEVFTSAAVPAMTRLRQNERLVLDTLVDAGVARSRSEALAWCVRLVGDHTAEWLEQLRTALADVERVREGGPTPGEGGSDSNS